VVVDNFDPALKFSLGILTGSRRGVRVTGSRSPQRIPTTGRTGKFAKGPRRHRDDRRAYRLRRDRSGQNAETSSSARRRKIVTLGKS
jgi:hypothetical protein